MNKLAVLLLVMLPAAGTAADETWYEAYASAEKAIAAKQWSIAEQELKTAITEHPQSGRNVRAYGSRFISYYPDYWLGFVFYHQGKYEKAVQQFDKVAGASILKEGDQEWTTMLELRAASKQEIDKQASVQKPSPEPSAVSIEPAVPKPTGADKHQGESGQPIASSKPDTNVKTETPPQMPETLPQPIIERKATDPINLELRKGALRAFYLGDYRKASEMFQQLVSVTNSPSALFYLACSNAGLSILDGNPSSDLEIRARFQFAEAMKRNPTKRYDTRFISPRILDILNYPAAQEKR